MADDERAALSVLEWAVATAPKRGETESGDRYVVLDEAGGALVAVVDGLGHGAPAGVASQRAVEVLSMHHQTESVSQLIRRCHASLIDTRGAVMSLARFTARNSVMSWLGVGDVDGRLVRWHRKDRVDLLVRSGIVGSHLPDLQPLATAVMPGDVLVITTDGIDSTHIELSALANPSYLARQILATYGTGGDDALVLVARYRGWEPASVR